MPEEILEDTQNSFNDNIQEEPQIEPIKRGRGRRWRDLWESINNRCRKKR